MDKNTYVELRIDGVIINLKVWYTYYREPFVARGKFYYVQFDPNMFEPNREYTFETKCFWDGEMIGHTFVQVTLFPKPYEAYSS